MPIENVLILYRIEHDDTGDSPDWFLEKVNASFLVLNLERE